MKEFTIKITAKQLATLAEFLNRAKLRGGEVSSFVEVMNVVNSAKPNDVEIDKPKVVKK